MHPPDLFDESGIYSARADSAQTILNGDAYEVSGGLPQGSFDLIVTSPPYNLGKSYEKQAPLQSYLASQQKVIGRLVSLLAPTGSLCWQVGNYVEKGEVYPLDMYFYPLFKELGLKLRNRIVWHFDHGLHASNRFSGRYETLLWFTKSDDYIFNLDPVRVPSKYPGKLHFKGENKGKPSGNPLGKNPSDFWRALADEWAGGVWEIPNVKSNHCEKTSHPCQFPVELVERCVLALTNPGGRVLDPFAGVGSSLIAAAKNGRHAVGIEQDAEYCKIAARRLADLRAGTLKLRPMGQAVHKPTGREKVARFPIEWQTPGGGQS